ncbi:nesprin-1 isoform X1, partial [Tachysurus ichikawai]
RDPPLVVMDLYEDIKDGVMLLALLEVLSGHKLVRRKRVTQSHGLQRKRHQK